MRELSPELRLLMLDVNGVGQPGRVPDETLVWLEEQLKEAREAGCQVLSFSHQNLLQHSMFTNGYVIENSGEVLRLYQEYGVLANFTGHLHIQHIAEQEGFFEIATSALSIAPIHYGNICISGEELRYETATVDVGDWAQREEFSLQEMLHFDEYAKEFFLETGRTQALAQLEKLEDAALRDEMADFFAQVNYAYFSGRPDLAEPDERLLDAWKEQSPFTGAYLESVFQGARVDQNRLAVRPPAG